VSIRAFTHATVWTAAGPPLDDATLVVEGGHIVSVGGDLPADAEIVDCVGRWIVPGFVDAHAHVGLVGEMGGDDDDTNETSQAITPYVRTLDSIHPEDIGFADARRGGVTTMGIPHGSANAIGGQITALKAYGTVVDDMVIREPAGMKMALGENPKRVGGMRSRAPLTRMGSAYLARKAFIDAMEYRKDWEHHAARLEADARKAEAERQPIREPKRDLQHEALLRVLDGEIPVRNHAHRADDIRTAIRLSEEFGYRLVIDHATEAHRMADEIVRRGIPVCVGPIFGYRRKREQNHRTPATVGLMVEAGAMVSIITDSPVNPIQYLREMVILAIREGLAEDRAIETVTINPARVLGVEDRIGSLEPGKDADFVIFDRDPWDGRGKVAETWIDGVRVFAADGPYLGE